MGSPVLTQGKGSSPDQFSSANGTQEKSQHCGEECTAVIGQSWAQACRHLCLSEKHLMSLPVRTEVGRERKGSPGSCTPQSPSYVSRTGLGSYHPPTFWQ